MKKLLSFSAALCCFLGALAQNYNDPLAGTLFDYEGLSYTIRESEDRQTAMVSDFAASDVGFNPEGTYEVLSEVYYKDVKYNVIMVGQSSFQGCNKMTGVILSDVIETIDYASFKGCTNLAELTMGCNVTVIDGEAFATCVKLREINCYAPEPPALMTDKVFEWCPKFTLHVVKGSKEAYEASERWSYAAKEIIDDLEPRESNEPEVDDPAAVEQIGAENEAPQYFNLHGVRVSSPERGIFIKVVNGKASKVVK